MDAPQGGALSKLTAVFERSSVEQRGDMFRKALLASALGDRDARALLTNIEAIWFAQRFTLRQFLSELSPDPGLLKALGYCVGASGQPSEVRRAILDYLWNSTVLPPIRDENYVRQWGEPRSVERAEKLVRVICNLVEDKAYDHRFDLAVSEWLDDLLYVEATWMTDLLA